MPRDKTVETTTVEIKLCEPTSTDEPSEPAATRPLPERSPKRKPSCARRTLCVLLIAVLVAGAAFGALYYYFVLGKSPADVDASAPPPSASTTASSPSASAPPQSLVGTSPPDALASTRAPALPMQPPQLPVHPPFAPLASGQAIVHVRAHVISFSFSFATAGLGESAVTSGLQAAALAELTACHEPHCQLDFVLRPVQPSGWAGVSTASGGTAADGGIIVWADVRLLVPIGRRRRQLLAPAEVAPAAGSDDAIDASGRADSLRDRVRTLDLVMSRLTTLVSLSSHEFALRHASTLGVQPLSSVTPPTVVVRTVPLVVAPPPPVPPEAPPPSPMLMLGFITQMSASILTIVLVTVLLL